MIDKFSIYGVCCCHEPFWRGWTILNEAQLSPGPEKLDPHRLCNHLKQLQGCLALVK